jgi:hypothetical protein
VFDGTTVIVLMLSYPIWAFDRPLGFRLPAFIYSRHMKLVKVVSPRTGHLYPQKISLVPVSVSGWVDQGHRADGRIESMKNSNKPIGNRIRNLQTCRAVPKPTASPRHMLSMAKMGKDIDCERRIARTKRSWPISN